MANEQKKNWESEVKELLGRAARLSVAHGVDVEPFVRNAYTAYVEARPGMRELLEEMQLRETLEEMRSAGRIASA